ncbi:MAG: helix-turn-helix domain-containing protein [Bacteroidetes bacterium]|nr:MAG: helix-turn-helix domain-containing protein [Bacteroidota bacterium]
MSADEASKYLGIKKAHLYKLTYKNELRYYKPGGKIMFFKKADLDAWAFRGEVKSKRELRDAV